MFGKIDCKSMLKVLENHHLPAEIKILITDNYNNCAIAVRTVGSQLGPSWDWLMAHYQLNLLNHIPIEYVNSKDRKKFANKEMLQ